MTASLAGFACGDNDAPCLHELPACGDCGPGEVRHALAVITNEPFYGARLTATSDGVACAACGMFFGITSDGQIGSAVDGNSGQIAVDPNGGFYALPCRSRESEFGDLVAYSEDGDVRWSVPMYCTDLSITADAAGVYVRETQSNLPVTAYNARNGAVRWRRPLEGPLGTHVDYGIVMYVAGGIAILDRYGNVVAERRITATQFGRLLMTPSRDGTTLAVQGTFSGTLDLGDTSLTSPTETTFLALLDIAGTTRWAYTLDLPDDCGSEVAPCEHLTNVAPVGDDILVSGVGRGVHDLPASTQQPSGFLGVFSQAGLQRVVPILGPSSIAPGAIVPVPDGSVWTSIHAADGLTIGSMTYTNTNAKTVGQSYAVNLVP